VYKGTRWYYHLHNLNLVYKGTHDGIIIYIAST